MHSPDPYQLRPEAVADPPLTLWATLQRIGPGMILAASIVGSGELINTTTLGAQVGYVALWLILLSCFIKPVIQAELGRYTIASSETGLEALNRVPGPRFRANWIVWAWVLMTLMTLLQIGAMYGGVAQVMHLLVPSISINIWVLIFYVISVALLLGGGYERIEKIAVIKVALFTMLTVMAAILLLRLPQYFSPDALIEGLKLKLPEQGIFTALSAFGITGVGASELFMYPYWCVEKGYAQYVGKRDGSSEWQQRARGWVRVMHVDILASMVIYTLATIAFYLLGAGVLNGMGQVPKAQDMIPVLSNIYTQTLGDWSLWLFYLGAIATLYGTIFAATAANSRVFADAARLMGFFDRHDYQKRQQYRNGFIIMLLTIPMMMYLSFASPVKMVIAGGTAQALMLPIIGFGAIWLRHRHLPQEIAPSKITTILLWTVTLIIFVLMSYYAWLTIKINL